MHETAQLTPFLSVTAQLSETDLGSVAARGFKTVINNRPDGESEDQPSSAALEAAALRVGLAYLHVPVVSGKISDEDVDLFRDAFDQVRGPVLAFCRSGNRSTTLWALSEAHRLDPAAVLSTADRAGYKLDALEPRLRARWDANAGVQTSLPGAVSSSARRVDVVVVGGGAAGIAVATSLLRRKPGIEIALVEPNDTHYYQPGWTLVGAGAFDRARTQRPMARCMPAGVEWIRAAAAAFEPDHNRVVLEDGERIEYRGLIVAPGLKLDWDAIEGLRETLGKNAVTSNYRFDMAAYTWELVQGLRGGRALFTQPPMPIKCAGAPQKAMYLSCDHWQRSGALKQIEVEFNNAGGVLFGVEAFVPPLMRYVERYGAALAFQSNLVAVDGPAHKAWFDVTCEGTGVERIEKHFDMLHVVPPQTAPDFVRSSPLADAAGWVEVNPETLQHPRFGNVFSLGDACSAPNAKTAAAIRKQAPVVARNIVAVLDGAGARALYDGYGGCPLTVERGKVVLAEFGYGGKLLPTLPLDPTVARRSAWWMKTRLMPFLYWDVMLKGREWFLAVPKMLEHEPVPHEAGASEAEVRAPGGARSA
ncbi:MAG: TIGR01244 family sulfur transferase [Gammaproteobacteria bacterium]